MKINSRANTISPMFSQYLEMIGVSAISSPSLEFLSELQKKHIETFGWDTLDLFRGRKIDLTPKVVIEKFKRENRGGMCYEFNGTFLSLLERVLYLFVEAKNRLNEVRFCRLCSVNIGILTKKPVKYEPFS